MRLVAEALRLEDFPMDRHGIDYSVGDLEVEDGKGEFIPVRDLTQNFGEREFRSAEEIVNAILDLTVRKKDRAA
jgi:hypothetical protein